MILQSAIFQGVVNAINVQGGDENPEVDIFKGGLR